MLASGRVLSFQVQLALFEFLGGLNVTAADINTLHILITISFIVTMSNLVIHESLSKIYVNWGDGGTHDQVFRLSEGSPL